MNNNKLILGLANIDNEPLDILGGKAFNLGKLISHGYPVPKGFVITTNAFQSFLQKGNLNQQIYEILEKIDYHSNEYVEQSSTSIRNLIMDASLDKLLISEIEDNYHQLSENVAVRSSATAEDLPTASFAGQQDTFLNVKDISSLIYHIKACYASLYSTRAIVYRENNKIDHLSTNIAVVVQEMVDADKAGVMFTVNPVSLARDEILIESSYGLGESIVSGIVEPDQFIVKQTGKNYQIVSRKLGSKNEAIVASSDYGVEKQELLDSLRSQYSLDDNEVLELANYGEKIDESFKSPQDIEWAVGKEGKFYILQSRPITSLISPDANEDTVWTRGYSDDYWNDPVSNLFFELLGDPLVNVVNNELNSIMGYTWGDEPLLKLYKGHVYFNLQILKRKVENEIPKFMRGDDVLIYFPEGKGDYGKFTMKQLPFKIIQRIVAELRVSIFDPSGSISKTSEAYHSWYDQKFVPYLKEFDNLIKIAPKDLDALMIQAKELNQVMRDHFRLVRYGLPVHNLGMNLLLRYLLSRLVGEEDAAQVYPVLISGLDHKTSETNERIFELVALIRNDPNLHELILEKPSDQLLHILQDSEYHTFNSAFEQFLVDFGDRGFTREPYYPRWKEEPKYVFDILKSLVIDEYRDPGKAREESIKQRKSIEKNLSDKLLKSPFGAIKFKITKIILNLARKYIVFREMQRYVLDQWITRNRQIYLEIGKILAQKSLIQDHADIFFLRRKEITQLASRSFTPGEITKISYLVKNRREEFLRYEHVTPPKFLKGNSEFDDLPKDTGNMHFGVSSSSGLVKGIIRVLKTIEDIPKVKSGEILVVPKTDPGWTPVFSKIGGLITETGGVLSHGAVVSREYGIPAVTNIRNACQIFEDGSVVTLDGNRGTVLIHNEE